MKYQNGSSLSPPLPSGPQMPDTVQCVYAHVYRRMGSDLASTRCRASQQSMCCSANNHFWARQEGKYPPCSGSSAACCNQDLVHLTSKRETCQPTCVKTLSCSIICSNASVTASGMLLWLSEGRSLMSSVFFFKIVGEHSDDIKEGFTKYPQISSPLSGRVLTVVSVVFDTIEKMGRVIFSKL